MSGAAWSAAPTSICRAPPAWRCSTTTSSRGVDGEQSTEHDRKFRSIAGGDETVAPIPGDDIVLTLDRGLQYQVEQALLAAGRGAHGGRRHRDRDGHQDRRDLRHGQRAPRQQRRRRVTSANLAAVEPHEPGSVAKVFSISAAVNEGLATPDTTIMVPGFLTYKPVNKSDEKWKFKIRDAEPHNDEPMSLRDIIVHSSNIGTVLMTEGLGTLKFGKYLARFGFGSTTGLGFPGESAGIMKPAADWQGTEKVTPRLRLRLRGDVAAAGRGGQHHRQRRRVRRAEAGAVDDRRRRRRPHDAAAVADARGRDAADRGDDDVDDEGRRVRRHGEVRQGRRACRWPARPAPRSKPTAKPALQAGQTPPATPAADPDRRDEPAGQHRLPGRRRDQGVLLDLRRLLPGRRPAGHDPRVDRRPDPTNQDHLGGKAAAPLFATLATIACTSCGSALRRTTPAAKTAEGDADVSHAPRGGRAGGAGPGRRSSATTSIADHRRSTSTRGACTRARCSAACAGRTTDGHDFAAGGRRSRRGRAAGRPRDSTSTSPQVVVPDTRVAMGRLAASFFGHPRGALTLVGVTGTNGKTTTTQPDRLDPATPPARSTGVIGTLTGTHTTPEVARAAGAASPSSSTRA